MVAAYADATPRHSSPVPAIDLVTFIVMSVVMVGVALMASYIPARRFVGRFDGVPAGGVATARGNAGLSARRRQSADSEILFVHQHCLRIEANTRHAGTSVAHIVTDDSKSSAAANDTGSARSPPTAPH